MPGVTADVATGTTITFGTSAWSANITSVGHGGISRESIDTSHLGTAAPGANTFGNRTAIPGDLSDPGEITLEGHFDTGQSGVTKQPPIDQPAETITVQYPLGGSDTSEAKWAGSGFCTSYEVTGEMETKITFSMTIKMTGAITVTAAS